MKQETNNEIDLLLRRLSRRQEVPVSEADSDHLDADELSAYAENALPAGARARYTEHLADCSKCREIVVQLSGSVPVVVAKETVPAVAPSGLRKVLASFFSPMVLRYAVPALGLIVVAAIGFVALRSRQAPVNVAQADRQAQSPAVSAETQQSPSGFYDSNDGRTKSSSPQTARQPDAEKPSAVAEEPAPPSGPPSGDVASPKTVAPAQRTEVETAANAAPARAEPAPAPSPTVDEMRFEVQGRRNEERAQGRDLAKQKTVEGVQEQEKKVGEFQSARERPPAPGAGAATTQAGRSLGMIDKAEKDRDDGVIRSVAGRRFRKQSGMWVDTGYSADSKIFDVARGSERFRSLVADEPEIKRIADELDGVVIVVWKGRTYRIR